MDKLKRAEEYGNTHGAGPTDSIRRCNAFICGWDACELHLKAQLAEYPVTIKTLEMKLMEGARTIQAMYEEREQLKHENAKLRQRLDGAGL